MTTLFDDVENDEPELSDDDKLYLEIDDADNRLTEMSKTETMVEYKKR